MESDGESEFYGDEQMVTELSLRADSFDVDRWWRLHNQLRTPLKIQSERSTQPNTGHLHNPYAGVSYAWQLTETVDDFLERLPPASTYEANVGPWIYICNPYIDRKSKADGQNQVVRGSEDEAPEEDGMDLATFALGGAERLGFVTAFHRDLKRSAMKPTTIAREKNTAAVDAAKDILELAQNLYVRCGKWMIFSPSHATNEIWATVAKATAENQLGIAAKVATRSDTDLRSERLICIYTANFADVADVRRVALKLKQLGLIKANGKPLYYKPDAYTYLGIGSGNTWGIKASIYNTREIMGNL